MYTFIWFEKQNKRTGKHHSHQYTLGYCINRNLVRNGAHVNEPSSVKAFRRNRRAQFQMDWLLYRSNISHIVKCQHNHKTYWKITTNTEAKTKTQKNPTCLRLTIYNFLCPNKNFGKVHNASQGPIAWGQESYVQPSKSLQLKVIASASFCHRYCAKFFLIQIISVTIPPLLFCFSAAVIAHLSLYSWSHLCSRLQPRTIESYIRLKCSHCSWRKPACQAWASILGKYVVALVIFKGSRKNYASTHAAPQAIRDPAGAWQAARCTPELGHGCCCCANSCSAL